MLQNTTIMFKKRENVADIEEGNLLSPKFDNDGLIPVVTTCANTKEILMHGYMNVEALRLTIETKENLVIRGNILCLIICGPQKKQILKIRKKIFMKHFKTQLLKF